MTEGMVSTICIKWREKEVLLVPNIDPVKPLGFWGLPGGKTKNGETPESAALRELAEETGQKGIIGKCNAEISKTGSGGDYIHYFINVKISPGKKLKNCGDPGIGEPKWIPFQEIVAGQIKMFRGHIQGLILVLEKIAEEKNSQGKVDRNGIPIISEGPSALLEALDELKNAFDANGRYIISFYRRRGF